MHSKTSRRKLTSRQKEVGCEERTPDKYEVCEGRRTEYINATGMTRTYTYFLCPDDPNQPFERYCCWDTSTGMGVCCSYDVKVYVYSI
ncbi:unnamed protein product [Trichobilharzia regenti]|nr:unnamed protein product [Trichobilharzia regenti]